MSVGEPYTCSLPEGFQYAGLISHAGAVCMTNTDALRWPSQPCPMLLFHGSDDKIVPLEDGEIWGTRHAGTEAIGRTLAEAQVPHWVFIEHGADHIVAMKELTTHLAETDEFIRDFVMGNATASVRTDWRLATPEDMATPEHMARFVPYYIYGFGKYLEEMDSLPSQAPDHIVY